MMSHPDDVIRHHVTFSPIKSGNARTPFKKFNNSKCRFTLLPFYGIAWDSDCHNSHWNPIRLSRGTLVYFPASRRFSPAASARGHLCTAEHATCLYRVLSTYSGGQVVLTHDPYPLPTPPPDSASSAGQ